MDPRIKKLEIEIENYTRAVTKRERQIEHFKDILNDRKDKLKGLKKPKKTKVKKKTKSKVKSKVTQKKTTKKKNSKKSSNKK
jgi:hypothetical protein|tara:strand:- start:1501 stop:1746 length:246 start_codon:yes stop_codon:yes gene_type:complete